MREKWDRLFYSDDAWDMIACITVMLLTMAVVTAFLVFLLIHLWLLIILGGGLAFVALINAIVRFVKA